jgi:hypothetical protein
MLVVCNGMIRSGSTLQYNLVRNLVEKVEAGRGHGFFNQEAELEDYLTEWSQDEKYHVIKTHAVHSKTADIAATGSARVFYTYRDIRDVAVSAKRAFKIRRQSTLLKALDQAVRNHYQIKSISGVMCQRYEDVTIDMPAAANAMADFLGLETTEAAISEIVEQCSLEKARQISAHVSERWGVTLKLLPWLHKAGIRVAAYDKNDTLLHYNHISEHAGAIGSWRTQMPKHESDLLTNRYEQWLQEEGYSLG